MVEESQKEVGVLKCRRVVNLSLWRGANVSGYSDLYEPHKCLWILLACPLLAGRLVLHVTLFLRLLQNDVVWAVILFITAVSWYKVVTECRSVVRCRSNLLLSAVKLGSNVYYLF